MPNLIAIVAILVMLVIFTITFIVLVVLTRPKERWVCDVCQADMRAFLRKDSYYIIDNQMFQNGVHTMTLEHCPNCGRKLYSNHKFNEKR